MTCTKFKITLYFIYVNFPPGSKKHGTSQFAKAEVPSLFTCTVGVVVTWDVAIVPPRVQFPDSADYLNLLFFSVTICLFWFSILRYPLNYPILLCFTFLFSNIE